MKIKVFKQDPPWPEVAKFSAGVVGVVAMGPFGVLVTSGIPQQEPAGKK
jgi:hypothetical protein